MKLELIHLVDQKAQEDLPFERKDIATQAVNGLEATYLAQKIGVYASACARIVDDWVDNINLPMDEVRDRCRALLVLEKGHRTAEYLLSLLGPGEVTYIPDEVRESVSNALRPANEFGRLQLVENADLDFGMPTLEGNIRIAVSSQALFEASLIRDRFNQFAQPTFDDQLFFR